MINYLFTKHYLYFKKEDSRVNIISEKDKYGMISKYMGYCIGFREKVILVTVVESIKLDMNLFNNRYINSNFKVVIFGLQDGLEFDNWLNSNQISIMRSEFLNDDIVKSFIDFESACIFICKSIKGGKLMYTKLVNVQIIISLLKQHGVRYLVLSPGNRDIPFVHSVEK